MKLGVVMLNFGEPENPTMESVVPFLERIFSVNASLMDTPNPSAEEVRARSRALAEARAPGLIEEYEEIGGSPLHAQAREQAEALGAELTRRGHDAVVQLGMQFTNPPIGEALQAVRDAGVQFLVPIGIYPLCGPSTTVAALREVDRDLARMEWSVPMRQISGWHRHPGYIHLRAEAIRAVYQTNGLDLHDPATRLVFSAHGTPTRYLDEGSRYDEYVKEFCAAVASDLGVEKYELGYQNHTNRPGVEWTQPDIDKVIAEVDADRVVVDACSFMHEQSETLAELDHGLKAFAEEQGKAFHRVPVPHGDGRFTEFLADLVGDLVSGPEAAAFSLAPCRCAPLEGVWCTNGARDLPPSPFATAEG